MRLSGVAAAGVVGGGVTALVGGTTASAVGFGFVPIAPYRSVDTRAGFAKIGPGEWDVWDLYTDEFGSPRLPPTIPAVTYNLTVTQTVGVGYLSIFPANHTWPGTSSINWSTTNADLANGGAIALGDTGSSGPGCVIVYCGLGLCHYIIDITGHFA